LLLENIIHLPVIGRYTKRGTRNSGEKSKVSFTDQLKIEVAKLSAQGIKYVGTRGWTSNPIWIVGEAPGYDENVEGFPFVGASGRELGRMLKDADIDERDVCFTNPYKVNPPDNDLSRIEEYGIPKQLFLDQFLEELHTYRPTFIVTSGAVSLAILCPQTIDKKDQVSKIGWWRGSLLTSPLLNWPHYVIPCWHPAFILREWSERQTDVLVFDRLREEFEYWKQNGKLQPLPEREIIIEPSYDTAREYLIRCLDSPSPISIDIELLHKKKEVAIPYTIAFALNPKSAMSVCFDNENSAMSHQVWRLTDAILQKKHQIGQNYISFDCTWLEWMGFRPSIPKIHDTMLMHHVLWPEMEHKLQFQTFQYTRQPYYKYEGKEWKLKDGIGPLMRYNALDAAVTYECYLRMREEFDGR
jgi:uracil-DNA glycosylase